MMLDELARLNQLAPLHQPHNLSPIRAIFEAAPHIPQIACFDTAFHRGQPDIAQSFALPRRFKDAGVRRYGFHGLSYEYLASRLRDLDPDLASKRVIMRNAHFRQRRQLCSHEPRPMSARYTIRISPLSMV